MSNDFNIGDVVIDVKKTDKYFEIIKEMKSHIYVLGLQSGRKYLLPKADFEVNVIKTAENNYFKDAIEELGIEMMEASNLTPNQRKFPGVFRK